jgi:hypothetical protein
MVAFVLATTHREGADSLDTRTYVDMALAAPGLPETEIGSAFSERLGWPWIAGTVAEVLPGGARTWLWVIVIASMIVVVALLLAVCSRRRLGVTATLLCTGLWILNPYTIRLTVQDPGPVDPLFVAGLAILVWALVAVRPVYLALGSLVAILGRQTALLAAPAAAPWLYLGDGWRERPARDRLLVAISIAAAVFIVYVGLRLVSSSFTYEFAPSFPADTILPGVGDPGSASQVVEQAARVAAPFVPLAGCIVGVLIGLRRAGDRTPLPIEFWCALLIGAAIAVQPLLISPNFEGFEGNQPRIASLGLVPVCVALVYLVGTADRRLEEAPRWALAAGAVALTVSSVHEEFSQVGPSSNAQFLAIEMAAAAVLAGLLAWVIGSRPVADVPGAGSGPAPTRA